MGEEDQAPLNQALEQVADGAAVPADKPGVADGSSQGASEPPPGGAAAGGASGAEINLDALMDVPVTLSVEIGRNRLPIKELLRLNQGAVVELDREVNEPLDLLVNGTLMARGEVVVVDGQFGLRLVDIVSPSERINGLK